MRMLGLETRNTTNGKEHSKFKKRESESKTWSGPKQQGPKAKIQQANSMKPKPLHEGAVAEATYV